MSTLLLISGIVALVAAFLAILRPYVPGAVLAYAGLWLFKWSGFIHPSAGLLASWGVIVVVVLVIDFLLPSSISRATNGMGYMGVGGLVGLFVGMTGFSLAWAVAGAAAGVLLGAFAYTRMPGGKALGFPSSRFFQYLCAKGLPAVVTLGLIGIALLLVVMEQYPGFALDQL